jgi:hypothetical protein
MAVEPGPLVRTGWLCVNRRKRYHPGLTSEGRLRPDGRELAELDNGRRSQKIVLDGNGSFTRLGHRDGSDSQ